MHKRRLGWWLVAAHNISVGYNQEDAVRVISTESAGNASVRRWTRALIAAVNVDNEQPDIPCSDSETARILAQAPAAVTRHASLAAADFVEAGSVSISQLRSDEVARYFRVSVNNALNILVARLIVAGGPWPGHYGLEVAAFTAKPARMPTWFPQFEGTFSLHFAESVGLSGGFQRGQGSVLSPKLLSTRQPVRNQGFGIVFMDRLTQLYQARVERVVSNWQANAIAFGNNTSRKVRELAFLAHEWGHFASLAPLGLELTNVDRRLAAIVGELQADLAAIRMLLTARHELAVPALHVLILDRVVREAWLPRAQKQVTSIVALQLLILLERIGCLTVRDNHPNLQPQLCAAQLDAELQTTRQLEAALIEGNTQPTLAYLTNDGWDRQDERYHVSLDKPAVNLIRTMHRTRG